MQVSVAVAVALVVDSVGDMFLSSMAGIDFGSARKYC
jgi:hypothetical protein